MALIAAHLNTRVILVVTVQRQVHNLPLPLQVSIPPAPFSSSLISLMVSVEVKHHIYLLKVKYSHLPVNDVYISKCDRCTNSPFRLPFCIPKQHNKTAQPKVDKCPTFHFSPSNCHFTVVLQLVKGVFPENSHFVFCRNNLFVFVFLFFQPFICLDHAISETFYFILFFKVF